MISNSQYYDVNMKNKICIGGNIYYKGDKYCLKQSEYWSADQTYDRATIVKFTEIIN